MRAFLRYLIVLTVIIMIGWLVIPQAYGVNFPRSAGPTFDRAVRYIYMHRIEDENPQIVLLGDSTLSDSINADLLGTLTGKKIAKFDVHGSASAYWYLILKNNIIEAEKTPPVVVIVFRDTILTAPGYRVHGSYLKRLDEFARRKEPLLLERSYFNLMNPVERVAESYVPLYGARENIRQSMDGWLRYTLPGWMGCDQRCTDNSMYAVFQAADLEPGQLQKAIAAAEQYLYTPQQLNFRRQIDQSYLPEIIRLARANRIQLILVRLKTETQGANETTSLKKYVQDLAEYLDENNVLFLDYGTDPRLQHEYYKDSLHLNSDGAVLFTQMLAEGLNRFLK